MKKIIHSAYSKREPVNHPLSGEPTRTKQEFKKEVDINEIVARMKRGISPPPWMTAATPRYGDFTHLPASFQESFAIVEAAQAAFESLPLEFRRALDHDPRNLDKAPRELYEQFGLVKKPEGSEAASAASGSPVGQRVQGDSDLPATSPQGSKNAPRGGAQKGQRPVESADE